MRAAAAIALVVLAAAGCGGGSKADEPRRWASAVDDICRETHESLASRGDAQDLRDLHRIAERASEDVRSAVKRIREVPISEETRRRALFFLGELDRIEPQLSEMTRTTAGGRLEQIGRMGIRLADATQRLQRRAESAGLHVCADTRQFDAVLDAFTAPVYATQVAQFERRLDRGLRRLGDYRAPSSPDFASHVRQVATLLENAERHLDDLGDFLPNRAVEAERDLTFALDAYENDLNAVGDVLRGGRYLTPVGVRQFNRVVAKRRRAVDRALPALRTAIGVDPLGAKAPLDAEKETA
jgi:hypothetical protein